MRLTVFDDLFQTFDVLDRREGGHIVRGWGKVRRRRKGEGRAGWNERHGREEGREK
jgi:hypothetical protein